MRHHFNIPAYEHNRNWRCKRLGRSDSCGSADQAKRTDFKDDAQPFDAAQHMGR